MDTEGATKRRPAMLFGHDADRLVSRLNRYLDSTGFMVLFLSGLTILYLLAYLGHPVLPGNDLSAPIGWWGWWDQGQYLKCAAALSHGQLTPETYWYPLGYPLTGALFYRWAPQHAFLIPNLVCVLGSTVLLYKISRRLVTPVETILLLLVFIGSYFALLRIATVEPWNTIPTLFLSYLIIFLVAFCQPSVKRLLAAFACVGLIFLCRPGDAPCMLAVPAIAILQLPRWKTRMIVAATGVGLIGTFILAVMLVNHAVFGSWRTPYDRMQEEMGVGSYSVAAKVFGLLIDGNTLFREPEAGLVRHFPWAILVPPGIVYLLFRYKTQVLGVILSVLATYGLYFLYDDFWPSTVYRYHGIHYLVWTIPFMLLATYFSLKEAWKFKIGRWSYLSVPLLLFLVFFVHLRERTIGSLPTTLPVVIGGQVGAEPVDWIFFEGSYTCPDLVAAGRQLVRKGDFEDSLRPDGTIVLLSTKLRHSPVEVDPRALSELGQIKYGNLHWTIRWKRPKETTDR
jgi:hypothetical protein